MRPVLADAAVLVSCPGDLVAWRAGRRGWGRGENPIKWVDKVERSQPVVAITGSRDDNTPSDLARAYVDALRSRGVEAWFINLPDQNH